MDALEAIFTRRSVRSFTDKNISDEDLTTLLKAAMTGPCCHNARDWMFVVIQDKQMLTKIADSTAKQLAPLKKANLGILVCGDLTRAYKPEPDFWIIDGSIAAQNMVLAAKALEIGSVWLGLYPLMDRVDNLAKLFNLPVSIVPHSIIAFGYPDSTSNKSPSIPSEKLRGTYEPNRVHYEKW